MQANPKAQDPRTAPWQWLALLAALGSLAADTRGVDPAAPASVSPAIDLDARRQRVQALSPERFEHVLHNRERLAELPADEQAKLRLLANGLERTPDAERLRHVMQRYHEWLRNLSFSQRSEVLELPPEQRLAKIKQIRAEQHAKIQAETADGEPLSPADTEHIVRWLENYALKHQSKLLAELGPQQRWRIEQLVDPNKRRTALLFVLGQRNYKGKTNASTLPPPTAMEIGALVAKLSPAARDSIHQAGAPLQQWNLIRQWSQIAMRNRLKELGLLRPMPAFAVEELQHFFESGLTPQQREQLLNLPPDVMQRELRRLFFQQPNRPESTSQPGEPGASSRVDGANDPKELSADGKSSKGRRAIDRLRNRATDAATKDGADPESGPAEKSGD